MSRKVFLIAMLVVMLASLSLSAVAAQDDTTIRWRTRPDNQAEIDVYTALSAQIDESLDGITLVYEPGGTETAGYQDTLLTEFAANNAPDIFWIPGADLARFVGEGAVFNLFDLASADADFDPSVFYPQQMDQLTYNPETDSMEGALWGLPRDASAMALYYNADLFDEAGIPYPTERLANGEWNWDTFAADSAAINALGDEIYGFGMNNWWGNWELFINGGGGSYFTEARDACAL
ncbi:MAG TPA: extracellular solute-binding protein, partial [Candidatus Limnocylindrales bacterium]|nr:extracellular solute-binding protein [Candidatus Limnocylindrales bacterium]